MKILGHILPYIGFTTDVYPVDGLQNSLEVSDGLKETVKEYSDVLGRIPTHVVVKGFTVAWFGYAAVWEQKIGLLFKGDL